MQNIERDPDKYIGHHAQQLELCPFTSGKILLRKALDLRAYKIQLVHELKPNDRKACRTFGEWILTMMARFSAENFVQRGSSLLVEGEYGNTENCRIWSDDGP